MKKKSPVSKNRKATKASASKRKPGSASERNVLFRPDRMSYVRKIDRPKGCVFCDAVARGVGIDTLLLYSGSKAIVIMNKFPYNPGHLLVLPKRHTGEFQELEQDELQEINFCLQVAIRAIKETSGAPGFNVGLNLGAAAGAGIPEHLHYHLVPRWVRDTNFFPLLAQTKVVVETLEQTYEKLAPFFAELDRGAGRDNGDQVNEI